jgi:elongation factor P
MATTADFRNGMTVIIDKDLYSVVEFLHVKPGKGGAFVRTKLKNVRTGRVIDRTFRAGESIQEARLERRKMQYLYRSGDQLFFMDTSNYEQMPISEETIGEDVQYLAENGEVDVILHEHQIVGVELPIFVELKVKETEPGVRGDTASGGSKPATLESGAVVQVPFFIDVGDLVRVDTRKGIYMERVKE